MSYDKRIREAQLNYIETERAGVDGNVITVTLPLSMSLIGIINRAQEYINYTTITNELLDETNFISTNVLGVIRISMLQLIQVCEEMLGKNISLQRWILGSLIIFAVVVTIFINILLLILALKLIERNHAALASFAFISEAEIARIIPDGKEKLNSGNNFDNPESKEKADGTPTKNVSSNTKLNEVTSFPSGTAHELNTNNAANEPFVNAEEIEKKKMEKMDQKYNHMRYSRYVYT